MLCLLSRRKPKSSVSIKSDLEGRNNYLAIEWVHHHPGSLNEVRPRRPEQIASLACFTGWANVSMKSGLEGWNNARLKRPP